MYPYKTCKHNYDQPKFDASGSEMLKNNRYFFDVLYPPALELYLPQQMKRLRMNLKLRSIPES